MIDHRTDQSQMKRSLTFAIAIALLAGCTSMGSAPPAPAQYADCPGVSWSWCAGYHGGH